ncbi:glycosyltransferase [Pedobacter sp. PLR]|uniref:glycosyltransferase family 2 protein n=1 Tax=Pedobacter sp. PLR TaxID=2994465 RepID=UPI002246EB32|nr:glycosyltransferase [Pedobacter sp. PLR]MCX2449931.1 glycosyltransferase [Pedobacter sp. PLR]
MERNNQEIMVSVCCLTYNHEKYIAQAVEGFVMQQTNFPIEIIIGEDCSTDRTRQILDGYASRYPDKIRLITSPSNVGANNNAVRVFKAVRGKYIAICDGDDYWTDPLKLQKQVDFLEQNEAFVMCGHYSKKISENNEIHYMNFNPTPLIYSFNDVMTENKTEISTLTIVFRNSAEIKKMYTADWFLKCNAPDRFIKLYTTFVSGKGIYILPETMSCYRMHPGGIWSSLKPRSLKQKELHDLHLIIKIFKYSWNQRIKLFALYIKKYFLFEVKERSLQGALGTMRTIL